MGRPRKAGRNGRELGEEEDSGRRRHGDTAPAAGGRRGRSQAEDRRRRQPKARRGEAESGASTGQGRHRGPTVPVAPEGGGTGLGLEPEEQGTIGEELPKKGRVEIRRGVGSEKKTSPIFSLMYGRMPHSIIHNIPLDTCME